ncbi:MAG: RidA family protein [Alphaproteobacteria bacterium]|nr:RidA family protein [Alphaproteobacteria bacterium]
MRKHLQPKELYVRKVGDRAVYSHVVMTDAPVTIYVAGQVPLDRDGNTVGQGDMRAQIRQVGANLKAALAAAGATLADVVKTNTYVTDIDEFFRHADVRAEIFGKEPPTSTTVVVKGLAHPGFMVEIEAIAVKEKAKPKAKAKVKKKT